MPAKLLKRGITDMVRISDARMSGTAYGTVVLHVCPEAAAGGLLALVRDGDRIELDVAQRRLHLDVTDSELDRRRADWRAPQPPMAGGYQRLYFDHVMQADTARTWISWSDAAATRFRGNPISVVDTMNPMTRRTFFPAVGLAPALALAADEKIS